VVLRVGTQVALSDPKAVAASHHTSRKTTNPRQRGLKEGSR